MTNEKNVKVTVENETAENVTTETTTTDTTVIDSTTAKVSTSAKTSNKKKSGKKNPDKSTKTESDDDAKTSNKKKEKKFTVNKKKDAVDKDKPKVENYPVRDKLFPKEFTVEGVKFTRLELFEKDKKEGFISAFKKACVNPDNANFEMIIAINWEKELLQKPSKARKSEYEASTGYVPPKEFPNNLDMNIIDAVLPARANIISSHSIYTEFPGVLPFEVFKKRTKDGYFDAYGAPAEFYLADYSAVDEKNKKVEGTFINLFDSEENNG